MTAPRRRCQSCALGYVVDEACNRCGVHVGRAVRPKPRGYVVGRCARCDTPTPLHGNAIYCGPCRQPARNERKRALRAGAVPQRTTRDPATLAELRRRHARCVERAARQAALCPVKFTALLAMPVPPKSPGGYANLTPVEWAAIAELWPHLSTAQKESVAHHFDISLHALYNAARRGWVKRRRGIPPGTPRARRVAAHARRAKARQAQSCSGSCRQMPRDSGPCTVNFSSPNKAA